MARTGSDFEAKNIRFRLALAAFGWSAWAVCNNPLLLWITLWASGVNRPQKPENHGASLDCLILGQEKTS
jgi:hypothetical protein